MDNYFTEAEVNPAILIVDDNPQNLQVLGRLLQEKEYRIEFATSGKAALEWIMVQQFDIILLDINMPEMDGFEVCREIRMNQALNNVPVIFLSADTDRESILKGFEMGAQDYVSKPFDSRELLVRVKTHLSLKASLEKLEKVNKYLEEKVNERTIQLRIANQNLESMNRELLELDNAKSEFLNLISHEIRTPLNGMILPLELLRDPVSSSESSELIEILNTSVKRLEKFSMNALLITRLKTRPSDIKSDNIDIINIINEVTEENQNELDKKGLSVINRTQTLPVTVCGESELIKKCIFNIVDNAMAFSPPGSSIEIAAYNDDQYMIVEIRDRGAGIPLDIIEKGTAPFSRGEEYRDRSTGIGLPLSRLIMEAHGGELVLDNNITGGAVVKLRFKKSC